MLSSVSKFVRNSIACGKLAATNDLETARRVNETERVYSGESGGGMTSYRISKYPSRTTMGFM